MLEAPGWRPLFSATPSLCSAPSKTSFCFSFLKTNPSAAHPTHTVSMRHRNIFAAPPPPARCSS
jgi:hypothetical protein